MRELIKNKNTDSRAADTFNLFCYQTKKYTGAYAAALVGLHTFVFQAVLVSIHLKYAARFVKAFSFWELNWMRQKQE